MRRLMRFTLRSDVGWRWRLPVGKFGSGAGDAYWHTTQCRVRGYA